MRTLPHLKNPTFFALSPYQLMCLMAPLLWHTLPVCLLHVTEAGNLFLVCYTKRQLLLVFFHYNSFLLFLKSADRLKAFGVLLSVSTWTCRVTSGCKCKLLLQGREGKRAVPCSLAAPKLCMLTNSCLFSRFHVWRRSCSCVSLVSDQEASGSSGWWFVFGLLTQGWSHTNTQRYAK